MVILFGNSILGRKPEILLCVERKVEAGSCKAGDTCIYVVKSLNDAVRTAELVDKLSCFVSVLICHNKLCCTAVGNLHLGIFVNIAVSVTCNCYRLFPAGQQRSDSLYDNGGSEYGTVKDSTDSAVRRLPHFL